MCATKPADRGVAKELFALGGGEFVNRHPGSATIISPCGTGGESTVRAPHMGITNPVTRNRRERHNQQQRQSRMLRVVLRQPLPAHGPQVVRMDVIPMAHGQHKHHERSAANSEEDRQACRTTLSSELLIWMPLSRSPSYSMKPSFLNLFMKKFTRERVVPIISDSVSWEMVATTCRGFVCLP